MYLKGEQVEVFPISIDRSSKPTSRVISESNLLKLIRGVSDGGNFIISKTFDSTCFEFMIHGYYIKLTGTSDNPISFSVSNGDVYATVFIDCSNEDYPQLYGSDLDGNFTGVVFSSDPDLIESPELAKCEKYSLKILNKYGSTYTLPSETNKIVDGGLFE